MHLVVFIKVPFIGICVHCHLGLDANLSFINGRSVFGKSFLLTQRIYKMCKVFYAVDILIASLRNNFALGLDFGGK